MLGEEQAREELSTVRTVLGFTVWDVDCALQDGLSWWITDLGVEVYWARGSAVISVMISCMIRAREKNMENGWKSYSTLYS